MNERIRELADQAGLQSFYVEYSPWQVEFEKFAELIVRECAAMAEGFEFVVERKGLSTTMKRHFGVWE
jgi:hypothetical protein